MLTELTTSVQSAADVPSSEFVADESRLDYEEVTPCLKEVTKVWEQLLATPNRSTVKFDRDCLVNAVKDGLFYMIDRLNRMVFIQCNLFIVCKVSALCYAECGFEVTCCMCLYISSSGTVVL